MEDHFFQYCKYTFPFNGSSTCCTTRSCIRGKMTEVKFYYFKQDPPLTLHPFVCSITCQSYASSSSFFNLGITKAVFYLTVYLFSTIITISDFSHIYDTVLAIHCCSLPAGSYIYQKVIFSCKIGVRQILVIFLLYNNTL